jgi:hypothetical protein
VQKSAQALLKEERYLEVQRKYEEMYGEVKNSPFNPQTVKLRIQQD